MFLLYSTMALAQTNVPRSTSLTVKYDPGTVALRRATLAWKNLTPSTVKGPGLGTCNLEFAPSCSQLEERWTHFPRAKSPTLGSKPAFCSHFRPFRVLNLLRIASIEYQECLAECPVFEQKCPVRNLSTFVRFEHYRFIRIVMGHYQNSSEKRDKQYIFLFWQF